MRDEDVSDPGLEPDDELAPDPHETEFSASVGQRLRAIRQAQGLSLAEVEARSGGGDPVMARTLSPGDACSRTAWFSSRRVHQGTPLVQGLESRGLVQP